MNVHEYVFTSIHGNRMPLSNWRGQPLLMVNTASDCEFTPQYYKLQREYMEYRESGLVVIGMPCNDFGNQEPGDEESIAQFVHEQFRVNFPMTSKIHAMGHSAHPFFQGLRDEYGDDVTPRWNFYKYLFNRDGDLVEFWPSKVEPDDPALTHQVERFLQSWVF